MDIFPCPFCGAPARLGCTPHAGEPKVPLLVQCTGKDCGATIEGRADEAAVVVVARWNRRASSPEARAGGAMSDSTLDRRVLALEIKVELLERTLALYDRHSDGTQGEFAVKEFPKLDDVYSCKECGMRLQCIAACECDDPKKLTLRCCGKQLTRTPGNADATAAPSTGPTS